MLDFFKKLFGSKKDPHFSQEELLGLGACPNCWGKQEYEGKYIEYVKDQTKANAINDKSNKKAFIQQFVETEITGIRLKKDGDYLKCPSCKGKTKFVSSQAS